MACAGAGGGGSRASGQSGGGTGPARGGNAAGIPTGNGDGVAVEIRLAFTPGEWADIQKCAAYDKTAPEAWAREASLSWIPETLDAIRAESLTPEERGAEESKAGAIAAAFRRRVAADEIGLSQEEAAAVALCGAWEGVGFTGFCRASILAYLESSFSDMAGFATWAEGFRHAGRQEKQWAARFHKAAAPIMARLGWNGIALDPFPAPLPDHRATGQPGNRATGQPPRLRFPVPAMGKNQAQNAAGGRA